MRKANREIELERNGGRWIAVNRPHKNKKRYYKIYGSYVSAVNMQKHFAKRIKRTFLHSQSVQEILQRLDKAYQRFFKHLSKRPPKFKRQREFSSFCYKQGGFVIDRNVFHVNSIKKNFKFTLSRPYLGKIKQVRVKRSPLNEYYICIITDATAKPYAKTHNGASVGVDFGLKTYLTFSNGEQLSHPQFLKKDLNMLRKLSKKHSRCVKDSIHKEQARLSLCRQYESISNKRADFQWKLAHELCRRYDTIFIEDLNLKGMSKLWGRKMSDLCHGNFCNILIQVASKYGCTVHKIDKWFPSSKLCNCGYKNDNLTLRDRSWVCPHCGQVHDRDIHASEMILRRGIYELASDNKTIDTYGFYGSHVCSQESHGL